MTDLRRKHGREKPWAARYWGVGNETWGCGGNMRVEFYADLFRQYATYLRSQKENKLYKIAVGPNTDDYHWTEVMMREARDFMDGLSLHYYTVTGTWADKGSATDFSETEWLTTMRKAMRMDELIRRHSTIMDRYDPEKRVGLVVDEWGTWHNVEPDTNPGFLYQQNTLRDALVAGVSLNIFNNHADRVHMANLAQTINVLQAVALTEGAAVLLTPTYHIFAMYQGHQDALRIPVSLTSAQIPADTGVIDAISVSASIAQNNRVLITLCNVDPNESQPLSISVRGRSIGEVTGRVLTGDQLNQHNTFADAQQLVPRPFSEISVTGDTLNIQMPQRSVVALELN
jgi:alpha-N-arabinofuranosidase